MTALGVTIVLAIFLALALLGPKFGADSRPGPDDPPEVWFRHCS